MAEIVNSKNQLSKRMNVAPVTINRWIEVGMPVLEDNVYDVEAVREWREKREEEYYAKNVPKVLAAVVTAKRFKEQEIQLYDEDMASDVTLMRLIKSEALGRLKIKEKSDSQLIGWFDVLRKDFDMKFDKSRVVKGLSTQNIAVLVAEIVGLKKKRKEIKQIKGEIVQAEAS